MVTQVNIEDNNQYVCYFCEAGEFDECQGCDLGDMGFAGTEAAID